MEYSEAGVHVANLYRERPVEAWKIVLVLPEGGHFRELIHSRYRQDSFTLKADGGEVPHNPRNPWEVSLYPGLCNPFLGFHGLIHDSRFTGCILPPFSTPCSQEIPEILGRQISLSVRSPTRWPLQGSTSVN